MLWLFFPIIILIGIIISLILPLQASIGYVIILLWIIFLIYLIFYKKDEVSEKIEKLYE